MSVAARLRSLTSIQPSDPTPLMTGAVRARGLAGNMGTADVRYQAKATIVITIGGTINAGDEFKLRLKGDPTTETIAFTAGTDMEAVAHLQVALRTLFASDDLTVAGTTDVGPFTVTFATDFEGHGESGELEAVDITGGLSVAITRGALAYSDMVAMSHPRAAGDNNGLAFDQESSDGAGKNVPLGQSIITDGTGQAQGVELLPPTAVVAASGGTLQVVVTATEHASGGTSAVVLYAVEKIDGGDFATIDSGTMDLEDADGNVTITGLAAATNYALHAFTQTAAGRVSRDAGPVFFTTA